jgi:hypothetical protein
VEQNPLALDRPAPIIAAHDPPTFFGSLPPALRGWPSSLRQLGADLRLTLTRHPFQFVAAIASYFGLALGLKLILDEMDVLTPMLGALGVETPTSLSWTKLSISSVIVGGLKAFIADYYSQVGRVVKHSVDKLGRRERFLRAAIVALVIGCVVSGVFTDNWLAMSRAVDASLGFSLPVKMLFLFVVVQTLIIIPYFAVFNITTNSIDRSIFGMDSAADRMRMNGDFWPSFWKAYLAATPANLAIAVAVPLAPPQVSFVITMTVSFATFLLRALATGK